MLIIFFSIALSFLFYFFNKLSFPPFLYPYPPLKKKKKNQKYINNAFCLEAVVVLLDDEVDVLRLGDEAGVGAVGKGSYIEQNIRVYWKHPVLELD